MISDGKEDDELEGEGEDEDEEVGVDEVRDGGGVICFSAVAGSFLSPAIWSSLRVMRAISRTAAKGAGERYLI